jgi:tRNA A37 threonylcarbamoyladenosine biosynthesis protein TsaE
MSRVGPRSWSSFKDNLESVRLPEIQLSGVITSPVGVNVYAVSEVVKEIIILSGPRQVGKTTLSKKWCRHLSISVMTPVPTAA